MKKNVIITPENLHLQKLSDVFESVLDDLHRMKEMGIKIDMNSYANVNRNRIGEKKLNLCTVCLGGAAVCGFMPVITTEILEDVDNLIMFSRSKVNGFVFKRNLVKRLSHLAYLFDQFRKGNIYGVINGWNKISKIKENRIKELEHNNLHGSFRFDEKLSEGQRKRLLEKIAEFIIQLRENNL